MRLISYDWVSSLNGLVLVEAAILICKPYKGLLFYFMYCTVCVLRVDGYIVAQYVVKIENTDVTMPLL